jgi:hypothetical protein
MEGELICPSCRQAGHRGDEERLLRAAIAAYRAEQDRFERDEPKGPLLTREALDENERVSVLVRADGTVTLQSCSENQGEIELKAAQAVKLLGVLAAYRDRLYEHRED